MTRTGAKYPRNRKLSFRTGVTLLLCGLVVTQPAFSHTRAVSTTSFANSDVLWSRMQFLDNIDRDIDEIATSPRGQWIIVSGSVVYRSANLPSGLYNKVREYIRLGKSIDAIAIASNNSWVVAAEDFFWRSANVPMSDQLLRVVKRRQNAGKRIDEITFTPRGGFLVFSEGYYNGRRVPAALWRAVKDSNRSKRRLKRASVLAGNLWLLIAGQWYASDGLSSSHRGAIEGWQRSSTSLDHAVLGPNRGYVMYSHQRQLSTTSLAGNLEYALGPSGGAPRNVWQRLNDLNIPGLSLAVIENNRIKFAKAYGVLEAGTDRWAGTKSPYPVASLAKYVTAIGVMRMIEEGRFTLNTNVRQVALSQPGILRNWQNWYQANGYTALPSGGDCNSDGTNDSVTVRRLLNHRAGFNRNTAPSIVTPACGPAIPTSTWAGGFGVGTQFEPQQLTQLLPTSEVLAGLGCSNSSCTYLNFDRIWIDPALGPPGSRAVYSNSGYEVLRAVMEQFGDGAHFTELMDHYVLEPLKMTDSTFVQPLPSDFANRAAAHHNASGNPRPRRSYQWLASGGLYASAHDYAKAMMVLVDSNKTHASGFLSPLSTILMSQDAAPSDGMRYGFGVAISDDGATTVLSHNGSLANQIKSQMVMRPEDGRGIVALVSGIGPSPSDPATILLNEIVSAWNNYY